MSLCHDPEDFGFRRRPARPRVGLCDGVAAQVNSDRFVMADIPVVMSRVPTLAGQAMSPISSPRARCAIVARVKARQAGPGTLRQPRLA